MQLPGCALDDASTRFLRAAASRLGWSARGFHGVLNLARTAADLGGLTTIDTAALAEAIQYRRVPASSDAGLTAQSQYDWPVRT